MSRLSQDCPFCSLGDRELIAQSERAVAFADGFPVSEGHTLVIPRRHEADYFKLSTAEQRELWLLVNTVRDALAEQLSPDGFNIGLNSGAAAGQTVFHAHVHVIPRFAGDVACPRGGVRGVIPDKKDYRA